MSTEGIEIRLLAPGLEQPLAAFFAEVRTAGLERFFHPHPLTAEEALRRSHYAGRDLYYVVLTAGEILAYGMLRGWDEGYEIPSLGIAVRANQQGSGLGRMLMLFLHCAARMRGARKVRLKVSADNQVARRLYESLGYHFEAQGADFVGFLTL